MIDINIFQGKIVFMDMNLISDVTSKVISGYIGAAILTILGIIYRRHLRKYFDTAKLIFKGLYRYRNNIKQIKKRNETNLNKIQIKLNDTKSTENPFIIIGGIYLDITADPVLTQKLEKEELTGIQSVNITLGGVALFLGQYLYGSYKQKSYLFSTIGKSTDNNDGNNNNGIIIDETTKQLKLEKWRINPDDTIPVSGKDTATTIYLIQKRNNYSTMLTHTGCLSSLTWELIENPLYKITQKPHVLYFSGFLKTGLYKKFDPKLRNLSKHHIICIDHGRLNSESNDDISSSLNSLTDVFLHNYVDIYICTFNEIFNYYNRTININHRIKGKIALKNRLKTLEKIAKYGILPPITIVRGVGEAPYFDAYTIVCKEVSKIETSENKEIALTSTKHKAIFNAVVLYTIINNQEKGSIETRIKNAVKTGLEKCHEISVLEDVQKENRRKSEGINKKSRKKIEELREIIDSDKKLSDKLLNKCLKLLKTPNENID